MLPGLPPYLPNVIQSLIQDTGEPIPPAIFTSLLLCMVAGNGKHLILRTTHEDDVEEIKALVVRVGEVAFLCQLSQSVHRLNRNFWDKNPGRYS